VDCPCCGAAPAFQPARAHLYSFATPRHWLLEGNQLTFELARHSAQKNILCAFVCDGEVKCVGKPTRTLATRMAGYKRPGNTQTTNIQNHRRIRRRLAR
jgi:hypothetical protein